MYLKIATTMSLKSCNHCTNSEVALTEKCMQFNSQLSMFTKVKEKIHLIPKIPRDFYKQFSRRWYFIITLTTTGCFIHV